jgi:alpha-amylase/alpha-mannosidase (GH57 family)
MPGEARLKVAFIWHMHQPFYKDPATGDYLLPWVRLHGTKDYYDMVALLDDFPQIRQTFNLVPSLLEQLQDYCDRGAEDRHLKLSRKPASSLHSDDKVEILRSFFSASPETMIDPYPRYRELHQKLSPSPGGIERIVGTFSMQDFLDLQVWSNLVWIDPLFRDRREISNLLSKKEGFSEADKETLLSFQREILRSIVPKYKEVEARGQIEVSISPYYHPILPLVYDENLAKVALPEIELPGKRFAHPEDADWQIRSAVELYSDIFGHPPLGMWPPEGSVCEEILPLFEKSGIRWIASDEEVLSRSLKLQDEISAETTPRSRNRLFKVYDVGAGGKLVAIFRDHNLSDLISFTYSGWDADKAVADLLGHLRLIRKSLSPDEIEKSLVAVIMDGENAWEYYKRDGHDFLRVLYTELSKARELETVTVSESIEKLPRRRLRRLFPGSWIGGDFRIWIGHPEDNLAWDLLEGTRGELVEFEASHPDQGELIASCWRNIYAAEGSDWFWWFGEEHPTPDKHRFDHLFRSHLLSAYEKMGKPAPEELKSPVSLSAALGVATAPTGILSPKIDGLQTYPEEWASAGRYDCSRADAAVHRSARICAALLFGSDPDRLYVRIDPDPGVEREAFISKRFQLHFEKPSELVVEVNHPEIWIGSPGNGRGIEGLSAFVEVLELGLPFSSLRFSPQGPFTLRISVWEGDRQLELWPTQRAIEFAMPTTVGHR